MCGHNLVILSSIQLLFISVNYTHIYKHIFKQFINTSILISIRIYLNILLHLHYNSYEEKYNIKYLEDKHFAASVYSIHGEKNIQKELMDRGTPVTETTVIMIGLYNINIIYTYVRSYTYQSIYICCRLFISCNYFII